MNDVARIGNGLNVRRPKKKANMLQDKSCLARYDNTAYIVSSFAGSEPFHRRAHGGVQTHRRR